MNKADEFPSTNEYINGTYHLNYNWRNQFFMESAEKIIRRLRFPDSNKTKEKGSCGICGQLFSKGVTRQSHIITHLGDDSKEKNSTNIVLKKSSGAFSSADPVFGM